MHTFTAPWSKSYCREVEKSIGVLIKNAWQTGCPWGSKPHIVCKYQLEKIFNAKYKRLKQQGFWEKSIGGHLYDLRAGKDLKFDINIVKPRGKRMAVFEHLPRGASALEEPWKVKVKKQIGENSCKTYNTFTCVWT